MKLTVLTLKFLSTTLLIIQQYYNVIIILELQIKTLRTSLYFHEFVRLFEMLEKTFKALLYVFVLQFWMQWCCKEEFMWDAP